MSYSKTIPFLNNAGSVSIGESGGAAVLGVSLSEQIGGGDVSGFAKLSGSINVSVDAKELIDAGLALAELKFPSASAEIKAVQSIIDAALSSV